MDLDIVDILREGIEKTFTRNGLVFMAAVYLMSVFSTVGSQSSMQSFLGQLPGPGTSQVMPLAMGGPTALWGLVSLLGWIGTAWLSIGIIRSFVEGQTGEIDRQLFTRNVGMTLLNLLVGGIVFGILVGLGFLLLIIPGIFLMVSLIFWNIYVVAEGQNFVEGMKNSWELSSGNRLELFLLGVGALVVGIVAGMITQVPGGMLGVASPAVGALISMIGGAFSTVFTLAALTETYSRLTA